MEYLKIRKNVQKDKRTKPQTQIIKVKTEGPIGPPKKDRKQSIKNKNNRSLSFHFDFLGLSVCGFVVLWLRPFFSGFSDVPLYLTNYSIKLIYMHIIRKTLNEGIKMMCFIYRFSVYFSRNQRKCSQNGEDENLKI